jgi:small glutamine-rich tetratricopeptide repeat-containing protein alpha
LIFVYICIYICIYIFWITAAVEAYKKCIELEPKEKAHKDALSRAKQKAQQYKGSMAPGGDFDMSSLAGALGKGGPGGLNPGMMQNPAFQKAAKEMMAGGGLDTLMKNPAMMQMAQQMMQNPAMMQQAMSMLGGGAAGGGGPDLGALAGMLGGLGGNPAGSGLAAPGSGAFFEDDHDAASSSSSRL